MRGKLQDGRFIKAPDRVRHDGKLYMGNVPDTIYEAEGWLEIVNEAPPEGMMYDGFEVRDGAIHHTFVAVPAFEMPEGELDPYTAVSKLEEVFS